MNTQQPEALLLADEIQLWNNPCARAAAELRRLHEANQELEHRANRWQTEAVLWSEKCLERQSVNAELLEALEWIVQYYRIEKSPNHMVSDYAKTAIARAEGLNKAQE